ncbi:aprataxin and PNK-like factor [Teleopsis dalmanni]|uniref:aprataxin and PNK-like factor n=1 Tax=Teleopsis dalmanni TaxID=139649 RepID=UPI0018CD0B8F|nr:aprataxin and PNK-like factor [Teleopsis dalmanni]
MLSEDDCNCESSVESNLLKTNSLEQANASEENVNNTENNEAVEEAVADINQNIPTASNNCTEQVRKRKLPVWMLSKDDDSNSNESTNAAKRTKDDDNTLQTNGNENGESSVNNNATPCIKTEPVDENEDNEVAAASSSGVSNSNIKAEPSDEEADNEVAAASSSGVINPSNIKPAVKVEKSDASSTSRESCKYGIRCYRQNPMHRIEEAHPGDHDYKRPCYSPPPAGTPDCPFGNKCYRRNPMHFKQYSHPADTNFAQNYKNYRMRLRQRRQQQNYAEIDAASGNSTDLDDYDLEDPFIDDEGSDYMPTDDDDDTEDEIDKAEE